MEENTIEQFLEDLSSTSPSPGGGSVAGLVAALSGSLNSMVYSLTINKKAFEKQDVETQKLVLDFKEASAKFTKKALTLMEEDREEFNKLMDCYKLPKETEEEKEFRNKEIKQKTIKAIMAEKHWKAKRQKSSNMNAFINEDLSGIKIIQSFQAEKETDKTFQELVWDDRKEFIRAVRWCMG